LVSLEVALRASADAFVLDARFRAAGGITALFGPSGAGKTLTLRHIAGLERAEGGRVVLDGRVLFDREARIDLPPRERRVGYVFQDYALFPHLDVESNIAFGLAGRPREERGARVRKLLALVELDGFEGRPVKTLSGGERQRVALARALAPEPALLLLDEPFAALDFRVRAALRRGLRSIQRQAAVPMILVTHSLPDVRQLSDDLVLLDRGRVVAEGPTADLLTSPASAEIAELLRGEETV
jgi:molybdate transport system ATP-binding protein